MGKGDVAREQSRQAEAARKQQQAQFEKLQTPTPGQVRFETGAKDFEKWLAKKDYSSAPSASSILNFDLWNPAHVQKQREKMGNIQGIGAANMGGTGDQSIALQMTRERNNNLAAEDAGRSWENAIKGTDNYYKSGDIGWSQLEINKNMGLLGNATNREMGYNQAYVQSAPRPWTETILPALLGGALGAAGSYLGRPR
jgi:hypothetical protein